MIRNILSIKNNPASNSWPAGVPFYIKNSLYPRYLLYCGICMWFVACPDLEELETLEDFISNVNYSFYDATENYLGCVLMIESLLMELSDFKEMLESDARHSNIAKNYYEDFFTYL